LGFRVSERSPQSATCGDLRYLSGLVLVQVPHVRRECRLIAHYLRVTIRKGHVCHLVVALGKQAHTVNPEMLGQGALTEGVATAESVAQLARKLGVSMPIMFAVEAILSGQVGIDAAIQKLLERPPASENQ